MTLINLVCLLFGGAIGTFLRYLFIETPLVSKNVKSNIILVNTLGSFFIGIFSVLAQKYGLKTCYTLFFSIGLLDAFTVMAEWALESMNLWLEKKWLSGFTNIFLNVFLSLGAVGLGLALTSCALR